jgi:peroxiredoxin Q/BCP
MVGIGESAPEFELESSAGGTVRLSSLRGHPVVLYFYPRAMTPGCTVETKGFRDIHPALAGKGVTVLGMSVDDLAAQKEFAEKCSIPFPLLADPTKATTKAYGVLNRFGEAKRVTFFIGADGRVVDIVEGSKPDPHVERAKVRFLPGA